MANHRLPRNCSAAQQAAWRKRVYLYGPVLVDATGTHRRLQSLSAIGWSIPALERYAGVKRWKFDDVLNAKRVHRTTAALVRRVYDELWNTPAPAGYSSARAKVAAKKNGWPVPAAWDDDEMDDPRARPKGQGSYKKAMGYCKNGHLFSSYVFKADGSKYGRCNQCRADRRARGLAA